MSGLLSHIPITVTVYMKGKKMSKYRFIATQTVFNTLIIETEAESQFEAEGLAWESIEENPVTAWKLERNSTGLEVIGKESKDGDGEWVHVSEVEPLQVERNKYREALEEISAHGLFIAQGTLRLFVQEKEDE